MGRTRWVLAAMVATIALIAIGPAVSASGADPPIPGILPTTTTTAKPKPLRPTTTTTAYERRVPEQGFGTGDHDPAIRTAELMLNGQHYDVGKIDDAYDQDTAYAVTAFQKIHGMERTGRLTRDVAAKLRQQKSPPPPLMSEGGARRAEIDLPRQVLLLVVDNAVFKVLPISSGSGRYYSENGHSGRAITPVGSYRVAYSVKGWQHSPLGYLYNPVYFDANRGLAIHGSKSVPAKPVSHGCVRIPMTAAEWFPGQAPKGMPVYVLDGRTYVQPLS
jgi:peptidoglycan hydrolase-like protein with peptidoglycan-binding domain